MSNPLIYVFNGDADGIIAQHLLKLKLGSPDLRITGYKRDIQLLRKIPPSKSAQIHVLDISLKQNLEFLPALFTAASNDGELGSQGNVAVTWYDHHDAGIGYAHPNLRLHIEESAGTCTAVIVNAVLSHQFPFWAAMAAYGDNIPTTAEAILRPLKITDLEKLQLRKAGVLLNYNAYGEQLGDVLFEPLAIANQLDAMSLNSHSMGALEFAFEPTIFGPLEDQFLKDEAEFQNLQPMDQTPFSEVYAVPAKDWARRFSATWANALILQNPTIALAIMHQGEDGSYMVSIRAPRVAVRPHEKKIGEEAKSAAALAGEFPTGGGRKLAAGINRLASADVQKFIQRFRNYFAE